MLSRVGAEAWVPKSTHPFMMRLTMSSPVTLAWSMKERASKRGRSLEWEGMRWAISLVEVTELICSSKSVMMSSEMASRMPS